MSWLAKLFGQVGTIRFEGMTIDGRTFTGKTKIETFGMSNEDVEEHLMNSMWVEDGIRCKSLKIIGFVEN